MKNTIQVWNLKTNKIDWFENKSMDCCLQALRNLGYEVTETATCFLAWKDGEYHYRITWEK